MTSYREQLVEYYEKKLETPLLARDLLIDKEKELKKSPSNKLLKLEVEYYTKVLNLILIIQDKRDYLIEIILTNIELHKYVIEMDSIMKKINAKDVSHYETVKKLDGDFTKIKNSYVRYIKLVETHIDEINYEIKEIEKIRRKIIEIDISLSSICISGYRIAAYHDIIIAKYIVDFIQNSSLPISDEQFEIATNALEKANKRYEDVKDIYKLPRSIHQVFKNHPKNQEFKDIFREFFIKL